MGKDDREWHIYGVDCFGPFQLERLIHHLLPSWYEDAEQYAPGCVLPDGTHWPSWATRKPKAGNALLDSTPTRPSEMGRVGKGLR